MLTTNSIARFSWLFIIGAALALLPDAAAAGGALTTLANQICSIVLITRTRIGKGIAVLGLIFLGIGAFFGKMNWGLALIIGIGVIVIFGSATIANEVAGFTDNCGTS